MKILIEFTPFEMVAIRAYLDSYFDDDLKEMTALKDAIHNFKKRVDAEITEEVINDAYREKKIYESLGFEPKS